MKNLHPNLRPWLIYPSAISFGFAIYFCLVALNFGPLASGALSVAIGALMVLWCERRFPYRASWRPLKREVVLDVLYIAVVQLSLPGLLSFLVVMIFIRKSPEHPTWFSGVWPHHWPIVVQLIAIILMTDLFRYCLHVAAHRVAFLWRFHAVHHAADKLYSLNAARFHPVEKALQFFLDSAPLAILGVREEVLAPFYVFYSLNAFLQHANISMHFGFLNYILNTAELHRWHHSADEKSVCNFGNNTIIWDIVFMTRKLPAAPILNAGIDGFTGATSFLAQVQQPFSSGSGFTMSGQESLPDLNSSAHVDPGRTFP